VDELIAFWRARLDEREQAARATAGPGWDLEGLTCLVFTRAPGVRGIAWCDNGRDSDGANAAHIAANDPASVLADVAADRALLALHATTVRREQFRASDEQIADGKPGWYYEDVPDCAICGWFDPAQGACETIRIRVARFDGHEDYKAAWKP